jgi:hypothetical protein
MVLTVIVVGGAAAASALPGITCGAMSTVVLKENHPQLPASLATSNNKAARSTFREARSVDMTASTDKGGARSAHANPRAQDAGLSWPFSSTAFVAIFRRLAAGQQAVKTGHLGGWTKPLVAMLKVSSKIAEDR